MTDELVVIGGGVMGLFCAYEASRQFERVVVLESGRVGDPATASFGRTRSYRSDYLDPTYVGFAREALALWDRFEADVHRPVLVRCGCMNIAKRSVTPDLDGTYAQSAHRVLSALGVPVAALDGPALRERYPELCADVGRIDLDGGVVDVRAVTAALLAALHARGVRLVEGASVSGVARAPDGVVVASDAGTFTARALVITAGHGTNDVLARLDGTSLQVPITRDRPVEAWYYTPPEPHRFSSAAMPVIAYLDVGIYCHPIVDGVIDAVKIGYYHPPDVPRRPGAIASVSAFVAQCLPGLAGSLAEPVRDVDGCDYDLVADDDFVLGAVPGFPGAYLGVGWRGTGYKFAPWVGRVLAQLAARRGTEYDIGRFDPARFAKGVGDAGASVPAQPVSAPV